MQKKTYNSANNQKIKNLKQELKEHKERFTSVVDLASDPIIQCKDGRIILWNKAAQKTFGYSKSEIIGKETTTIIPKDHLQGHIDAVDNFFKSNKKIISKKRYEVNGLRKNGTLVPLELSLSKWITRNSIVFTAILRDVTKRKENEQKLKTAYDESSRIAEILQRSLLPADIPKIEGLEIRYFYKAITGAEVGGDFFDVFETTTNSYGILIGDISGKGIEVAAETARVKYMLRDRAFSGATPEKVVYELNNAMANQNIEHFAALTYCLYDPKTNVLSVTNSGNPYPYHVTQDKFIEIDGSPMSLFKDTKYSLTKIELKKDDIIMFYTDGLVETRMSGELFGQERVSSYIKKNKTTPTSKLLKNLINKARDFSDGELKDDILIVSIKKR